MFMLVKLSLVQFTQGYDGHGELSSHRHTIHNTHVDIQYNTVHTTLFIGV